MNLVAAVLSVVALVLVLIGYSHAALVFVIVAVVIFATGPELPRVRGRL